jgi:biotin carboxyl carrier protein
MEVAMHYIVTVNGRQHTVELTENGHQRQVTLDSQPLSIDWRLVGRDTSTAATHSDDPSADQYSLVSGIQSYVAYARRLDEHPDDEQSSKRIEVMVQGHPYVLEVQDARSQALASLAGGIHASGEASIRAPMPGLVSSVLVSIGDEVQRGETIVVLEAMKMENDLTTPRAGRVRALRVTKGQTVSQDDVLAIIGDVEDQDHQGDDQVELD